MKTKLGSFITNYQSLKNNNYNHNDNHSFSQYKNSNYIRNSIPYEIEQKYSQQKDQKQKQPKQKKTQNKYHNLQKCSQLTFYNLPSINIQPISANTHYLNYNSKNKEIKDSFHLQNIRLIQANYKLVHQLVSLLDFLKKYLNMATRTIDQYKYLQTTKIIHQIIGKLQDYQHYGNLSYHSQLQSSQKLKNGLKFMQSSSVNPYQNPQSSHNLKKMSSQLTFCKISQINIKPTKQKAEKSITILGQQIFSRQDVPHELDFAQNVPNFSLPHKNYSYRQSQYDYDPMKHQKSVQSQNPNLKFKNRYDINRFKPKSNNTSTVQDLHYMLLIQAASFEQFLTSSYQSY